MKWLTKTVLLSLVTLGFGSALMGCSYHDNHYGHDWGHHFHDRWHDRDWR